jgi:hypothetical protein
MQYPIQPRESVAPRSASVPLVREQVRQEIQSFLHALDSYPARVAKEPRVSFHQHLCSVFDGARDDPREDRRDDRRNESRDTRLRRQ